MRPIELRGIVPLTNLWPLVPKRQDMLQIRVRDMMKGLWTILLP